MRLGKLPYELSRDGAPPHQILLAVAFMELEIEETRRQRRTQQHHARRPREWQTIHSRVDRAAAAIAALGG